MRFGNLVFWEEVLSYRDRDEGAGRVIVWDVYFVALCVICLMCTCEEYSFWMSQERLLLGGQK